MTDPIVPDDLARSKSGRIPQWVLDEAMGLTTEPVPFRAAPTPQAPKQPGNGRGMRWLRIVLTLAITGAVVAVGALSGFGHKDTSNRSVLADEPKVGFEETGKPLGVAQPVAHPSSSYRFETRQDDNRTPVTWSPCRPIHYAVRTANAPAGGQQLLERALARASAITGLRFVYDGTTLEDPRSDRRPYQPSLYPHRWAPVLVTWATKDEVPDFDIDVLGEAYAQPVSSTSGDLVYVTGGVTLDPVGISRYRARYGEAAAEAVVLHEVGHLLGLDHVTDKKQIMYPAADPKITDYQAGDLTGLHALGTGPCQRDV